MKNSASFWEEKLNTRIRDCCVDLESSETPPKHRPRTMCTWHQTQLDQFLLESLIMLYVHTEGTLCCWKDRVCEVLDEELRLCLWSYHVCLFSFLLPSFFGVWTYFSSTCHFSLFLFFHLFLSLDIGTALPNDLPLSHTHYLEGNWGICGQETYTVPEDTAQTYLGDSTLMFLVMDLDATILLCQVRCALHCNSGMNAIG